MHVVITGASSGIGESIARAYVAEGANVTLVARRREPMEAIKEIAEDRVHVACADLADPHHAYAWIDEAEKIHGSIDVLVNNAGVQIVKSVVDTEWSDAERLLRLDLHVPLRITSLVLPKMIARKSGTIVDIASMASLAPTPGMFFYNAAKAGLAAASEGLRAEVKKHGVHVVTVYPGPVTSAMEAAGRAAYEEAAGTKWTPTGSPDTLAAMIVAAVRAKRARVIYPRVYALSRHFPNLTRWALDALTPPLKPLPPA